MTNSEPAVPASPGHVVLTTTANSEEKAAALAEAAVGERLAACAQIHPVASVYRWEGEVEHEREWRIDFKTRGELTRALSAFITERHDYKTPEIIAVPVVAGSAAYLSWLTAETAQPVTGERRRAHSVD
ncbi:divalent-cation tolerance protein CutA [Streptomyces sp. CAU 1734]|uniref:divalent-cation tolerance protein CutA n=1 Tax=Streptomyces sp. CAU 1734 TaxID=3140360 RepID=UPI003261B254